MEFEKITQDQINLVCQTHKEAFSQLTDLLIIERSKLETKKLEYPDAKWVDNLEGQLNIRQDAINTMALHFDMLGALYEKLRTNCNLLVRHLMENHDDDIGMSL